MKLPLPNLKAFVHMKKFYLLTILTTSVVMIRAQAPGGVSSGLNVWLKADAGTSSTTDGAFITSWNDQSPNGNHATQSTAAAKPQFVANAMNGNPVIKTSSTRFFNVNFDGINNKNYTIFTVTKRLSGSNFQHILGVTQAGAYVGLGLGYSGPNLIRQFQYGNIASIACTYYNASTEIPAILSCQFDTLVGKRVWQINDGVEIARGGTNKTRYALTGTGKIGRGNDTYGFTGQIAEVIVYNRVLSTAEKKQVHTYLAVKYGLSVPGAQNLYYNESAYSNDVFGIGKNVVTQGLNQSASSSVGLDDPFELRNPSALDDGDYMMAGNNGAATTFSAYTGTNCSMTKIMARRWKVRVTGTPGTVTTRFDMTGLSGFTGDRLLLLIDSDGDGFDDEMPLSGTYNAPYFDVNTVNIPDGSIIALGVGDNNWYAVASGNASGAIWSTTPNGTPQLLTSICSGSHIVVNTGVTVNNDWPTMSCHDFTLSAGSVWNASSGTINVGGQLTINGIMNSQTSTIVFNGTAKQYIKGSGITNCFNLTQNNVEGVEIESGSGGVRVRNIIQISSGTFTTNSLLMLISDIASTGMIASLANGAVTGNVTVQRYHHASAAGWVNLSCPVQNKTIQDWNDDLVTTGFVGADFPPPYSFNNVQRYNEAASGGINSGFVGSTNVTNALLPSTGYFVYMNAGNMNLDVDGSIYSGDQSLPITFTSTGSAASDGWNLIGNPYPCTIDWNSVSWTKTNINNAVYVWNAATGQYASYVNGVATNGGSRYIPSSQSFFVVANAASPVLTLRENCKSTNQGTFKSTEVTESVFTLHIANDAFSDETSFARNESGSLMFESEFDAYKIRSPLSEVPYMASISQNGDDLSINAFADMSEETIIPLRIESGVDGMYTITHQGLNSFANGACVVFEDLLTGNIYPLNQYEEIELQLFAGNDDLRFQLRIGATSLSNVTSAGCPGMEAGMAVVEIPGTDPVNITWMNGEGEVILTSIGATGSEGISNLAPGTYFAVIDHNGVCGATQTEFRISEDVALFSNTIVTPATCMNAEDGGAILKVMGGTEPYNVTWSNGATESFLENTEGGDYTAFVTDAKGCVASFIVTIPVASNAVSSFETIQDSYEMMNGSVLVDFFNTSENAGEYVWNFGDGTQSTDQSNPSHIFNQKGIYEVTLVAVTDECETAFTKSIKITNPANEQNGMSAELIGTLTDNGVQIMFFFDQPRNLIISAYNVLGQQLIEPIKGTYERQTITFSDRRYAANALIEVIDINTGDRALLRMGM